MKQIVEKILNVVFPPRDESGFFINWKLADFRNRLQKGFHHNEFSSLFSYQDENVRKLIKSFKKEKVRATGRHVAELLAEEILNSFSDESIYENKKYYIVPIPISRKRMTDRGFNQTEWISTMTTVVLGGDFVHAPHFLKKTRNTAKQSTLSRTARLKNPKHSFSAHRHVLGKQIILVDDVITTGATVADAVRALKAAGAAGISIYCIAH